MCTEDSDKEMSRQWTWTVDLRKVDVFSKFVQQKYWLWILTVVHV